MLKRSTRISDLPNVRGKRKTTARFEFFRIFAAPPRITEMDCSIDVARSVALPTSLSDAALNYTKKGIKNLPNRSTFERVDSWTYVERIRNLRIPSVRRHRL